jgi:hypothetical protein
LSDLGSSQVSRSFGFGSDQVLGCLISGYLEFYVFGSRSSSGQFDFLNKQIGSSSNPDGSDEFLSSDRILSPLIFIGFLVRISIGILSIYYTMFPSADKHWNSLYI